MPRENIELDLKKVLPDHYDYTGVRTDDNDNVGNGKPYKRKFTNIGITKKGAHLYEPIKSVPCILLVIMLGLYLLLGYLTLLVDDQVTRPTAENEVPPNDFETFSEEVAWRYILEIAGDQPRVSGTPYHLQKTIALKNLVDRVASEGNLTVHTDWQLVTGDYILEFTPPHVNYYQNASNVIALLEGEAGLLPNGSTSTSLLVNCHYDSVPYAIGVSDDVIFCGAMLEILHRLSKRGQKLKHNIVFLFNGAEENPLQAAHGFLVHPWAHGVTNVINLEAAGMNGKPKMFQVTDPRLLTIYKKATGKPNAQSFGEFMFSSGLVPSDTDFRLFRDFGDIQGVDIAFVKGGLHYHTRYDHPDYVKKGVVQNAGEMLLGLVALTADAEELAVKKESETAVYYDYLNAFMVSYSIFASYFVDAVYVLFGIASVMYYVWLVGWHWSTVEELCYAVLSRILALGAGLAVTAVLVSLMIATTIQLRYLSQPWIVVPIFWLPYVIVTIATSEGCDLWRVKKCGYNRSVRCLQASAATRFILIVTAVTLMCIPGSSTVRYLVTVTLFILGVTSCLSLTVLRIFKMDAWQHLFLEIFLSLPSTVFLFSVAIRLNALMLPIMARNSSNNPDFTVAMINAGLVCITACCVSGIELLISRKRLWIILSACLLVCVVIILVPINPYSDDGPSVQRHYWFRSQRDDILIACVKAEKEALQFRHTEISTYNFNGQVTDRHAGLLITKYDAYTTHYVLPALRENNINLNYRTDFNEDCSRYLYCNLPLFRTRFSKFFPESLFLYTGAPAPFDPVPSLRVVRNCIGETCTFNFTMIGPAHNLITLWPKENVNITWWSFSSPLRPSQVVQGRSEYDIVHSFATYSEPLPVLEFSIVVTAPFTIQQDAMLDVSHHAHKIHHPQDFTQEYNSILQAMPKYFNIASFLSLRNNYEF